jgi:hypothetical protein
VLENSTIIFLPVKDKKVGAGLVPARIVRQHDDSFCCAKSGQGQALPLLKFV